MIALTLEQAKKLVAMALLGFPSMQDKAIASVQMSKLWQRLLYDMPYEIAEKALLKVLMNTRYFPTVAEIREAAESMMSKANGIPAAEDAWEEVCRNLDIYRKPNWSHPLISKVVKLIGFRNMCCSENLSVERGQFFKIYTQYEKRARDQKQNDSVAAIVGKVTDMLPPITKPLNGRKSREIGA